MSTLYWTELYLTKVPRARHTWKHRYVVLAHSEQEALTLAHAAYGTVDEIGSSTVKRYGSHVIDMGAIRVRV